MRKIFGDYAVQIGKRILSLCECNPMLSLIDTCGYNLISTDTLERTSPVAQFHGTAPLCVARFDRDVGRLGWCSR